MKCKGDVRQRKHSWSTLNCSRSFSCTCFVNSIITFIFKVVTLIIFVLAECEPKKMWSKFDNAKFNEENLNKCSVFFIFKGLRNVKTLRSFFFQTGILYPAKHIIKSFLEKKHVLNTPLYFEI